MSRSVVIALFGLAFFASQLFVAYVVMTAFFPPARSIFVAGAALAATDPGAVVALPHAGFSTEQITAVGAAVVSVLTAIGGLLVIWVKIRDLTSHVNSKLDLLLKREFEAGGAAERERATGEPKPPAPAAGDTPTVA